MAPIIPEIRVELASWKGDSGGTGTFIRLTEKILLPVVGKDIFIHVPHDRKVDLAREGKFHIHIWSSVRGRNSDNAIRPPAEIYGIPVSCRDGGYEPCGKAGESTVFSCPQTGYAVAELFEDNLFIHYDICHYGERNEYKIYEKLLTEVAAFLAGSQGSEKELQRMRESLEKTRAAFLNFCCSERLADIDRVKKVVGQSQSEVEEIKKKLADCLSQRAAAGEKLEQFAAAEKTGAGSFGAEFDKLLTVPGVLGVEIKGKILKIYTSMIRIVEAGATYRIGRFRIEISMAGGEGSLKFFNLTNGGKGPGYTRPGGFPEGWAMTFNRHHPHVKEDGFPCLGNLGEAIPRYILANQYSVVAILALQFLQTVNTEDQAGKGINWWPKEGALVTQRASKIRRKDEERRDEADEPF